MSTRKYKNPESKYEEYLVNSLSSKKKIPESHRIMNLEELAKMLPRTKNNRNS